MPLEPRFIQIITEIFDQMVEHNIKRMNTQDEEEEKKVWKYENSFDYHYGRTMGMITRITREEFIKMYKREALPDETIEIIRIMDANAVKIRHAFAFLKKRSPSES